MKTRYSSLIISFIFIFLLISSSKVRAQEASFASKWQEDLKYLQHTIHKDFPFLFKKISAADFDSEVSKLHTEIPSLEAHELPVAMARIVSLFKYGHTQIPFSAIATNGILPINFYHFDDGVYIEGTVKEHAKVLGARVIKIGDTPIDKALELIKPVVPVENDQYFKAYGIRFLGSPDVLHTQKVISKKSDKINLTLEKEGRIFEYTFSTIPLKDKPKNFNFTLETGEWKTVRDTHKTPLYLKHLADKYYYFEHLPNSKTVYVRQSSVFNDKRGETLKEFYERLFNYIDTNAIDKLIYDVRLNGGGNNYNNMPLVKGIMARPTINKRGNLFYIIGRETFSACQNLTNEISRYTEAIIVGEPTSENINFYGDTRPIKLPNSGITAYLSFAWWQDFPQWENKDATVPHIAVDMSYDDYKTNKDPVLEAVLNYNKEGGVILDPMKHLTELFIAGNYAQVKIDGAKFAKDKAYKHYNFKKEFNQAGEHLLQGGNTQGGLFILELIAEYYPNDQDALYNLAVAQENAQLVEKAKDNYQKLIKLNANSAFAKSAESKLKELNKE